MKQIFFDSGSPYRGMNYCPKNDANTVVGFLQRNILSRFGTPRTIIRDGGSHFANKVFDKPMGRYGIKHIMSLASLSPSNKWAS